MDATPSPYFSRFLATARANLAYVGGTERPQAYRQAAREALQEWHSSLSQPEFFAVLDALGGQQALLERLEAALAIP